MKKVLLVGLGAALVSTAALAQMPVMNGTAFLDKASGVESIFMDNLNQVKEMEASFKKDRYKFEVEFTDREACKSVQKDVESKKITANIQVHFDCYDDSPSIELIKTLR